MMIDSVTLHAYIFAISAKWSLDHFRETFPDDYLTGRGVDVAIIDAAAAYVRQVIANDESLSFVVEHAVKGIPKEPIPKHSDPDGIFKMFAIDRLTWGQIEKNTDIPKETVRKTYKRYCETITRYLDFIDELAHASKHIATLWNKHFS